MAKKGRGRRGGFKIPVISVAILAGQALLAHQAGGGALANTLNHFQSFYTGYDFIGNQFRPQHLVAGYVPWLAKRFLLPIARPRLGMRGLPISIS
ncbi:MAG TPA: hypothetical protein VJN63_09125 [Thermoplasmata archaeon]|nr:hypothetical protein [Thermoplasmata archaeon]